MELERRSVRFGELTIEYDARVLEPRTWTQLQSRWAAELAVRSAPGRGGGILELCAGAGHIGLLAARLSDRDLVCVDIDSTACEYARRNAERAGLSHRVTIRTQPLETSVRDGEVFAVVVADPPWVPSTELSVFGDDPLLAIDGGPDGLDLARACTRVAQGHLAAGGSLLLQLGTHAQADRMVADAEARGWADGGRRDAPAVDGVTNGGVVLRLTHR